uniref:PKD_channel domain-containing protein n=1 Tax=Echinostoma caproni TaxID=27848 RepID=A0A183ARW5_9TREM
LVHRLQHETLPSRPAGSDDRDRNPLTCSEEELQRIISKFTECDYRKCPVESTRDRQHLGFNRYDYYHGPSYAHPTKQVSPDELQAIIDRLIQYDINKGPPGSRGHERLK